MSKGSRPRCVLDVRLIDQNIQIKYFELAKLQSC